MAFKFYYGEIIYYKKSRINAIEEVWKLAIVLKANDYGTFIIRDKETGDSLVITKDRMLKLSEMKVKLMVDVK